MMALARPSLCFVTCLLAASLVLIPRARAEGEETAVAQALRSSLEGGAPRVDGRLLGQWRLVRVYQSRDFRPLWLEADGGARRARQLAKVLKAAERDGLDPKDYAIKPLTDWAGAADPRRQADLELLITSELLHYLSDLRHGRAAIRAAEPEVHLPPGRIDIAKTLEAAEADSDLGRFLASRAPAQPAYRALRRLLAELRNQAAWRRIPGGKPLEEGMTGRRVALLRKRLLASGDLTESSAEPKVFDYQLADAVHRFQSRHDLEPDGVAGPATLRALNRPMSARIQQVIINMERLRWLPDEAAHRAIIVNLAGFQLAVLEGGWPVLTMPVIIGKRYRRSPMFSGTMTYLELNPTWTVPESIAAGDYLPKLRRDPGFLAEESFRVITGGREVDPLFIDWSRVPAKPFPYILRQDPGPGNALGRVKFMFPNRFHVYLHDTPAGELFSRRVRTFSSGCIRVADPLALAGYLLKDDPKWTPWRVDEVLDSGETTEVPLRAPMPIYLTYATIWIGDDGAAQYRGDIYGRDAGLGQALFGRAYRGET